MRTVNALGSWALGSAVALSALGLGRWLLRRIDFPHPGPAGAFGVSLALGAIALGHLFLGLALLGVIDARVYGAILAAALAGALPGLRALWRDREAARAARPASLPAWLRRVLIGAVAASLAMAALSALAPVSDWDARGYHLEAPRRYLRDGAMRFYFDDVSLTFYNAQSMLNLWLLALGSDTAAQVLSWWFAVAMIAIVYAIAERMAGTGAAALAAALVASFAFVAERGIQASPDMAATLMAVAPVYVLGAGDARPRSAALIGVLAGGALVFRVTSAITLLPIGLLCLAWWATQDRVRGARLVGLGATAAIACALCVLPWALRTYLATGDPVYPFLHRWVPGSPWTEASARHGLGQLSPGSALSLERLRVQGYVLLTSIEFNSFVLALAALAPLAAARRRAALLLLAAAALGTLLGLLVSDYPRYFAPAIVLAAVLAGQAATWMLAWPGRARSAFLALWLLVLAVALGLSALWHQQFIRAALGLVDRDVFLERRSAFHRDYLWMNEHLPRDAVVMLLARESYYLDRRSLRFAYGATPHIGPFDFEAHRDSADLLRALRAEGVTHLFVPDPEARATALYWDPRFLSERGVRLLRELIDRHGTLVRHNPASLVGGRLAGVSTVQTWLYDLRAPPGSRESDPPSAPAGRDDAVLRAERDPLESALERPQPREGTREHEQEARALRPQAGLAKAPAGLPRGDLPRVAIERDARHHPVRSGVERVVLEQRHHAPGGQPPGQGVEEAGPLGDRHVVQHTGEMHEIGRRQRGRSIGLQPHEAHSRGPEPPARVLDRGGGGIHADHQGGGEALREHARAVARPAAPVEDAPRRRPAPPLPEAAQEIDAPAREELPILARERQPAAELLVVGGRIEIEARRGAARRGHARGGRAAWIRSGGSPFQPARRPRISSSMWSRNVVSPSCTASTSSSDASTARDQCSSTVPVARYCAMPGEAAASDAAPSASPPSSRARRVNRRATRPLTPRCAGGRSWARAAIRSATTLVASSSITPVVASEARSTR
jgi:hypothetical protein